MKVIILLIDGVGGNLGVTTDWLHFLPIEETRGQRHRLAPKRCRFPSSRSSVRLPSSQALATASHCKLSSIFTMNKHDKMQQNNLAPITGSLRPGDAFVAICDWKGTVKWLSNQKIKTKVGDFGWVNMIPADAERFKQAFARTATLHERHVLEIQSLNGLRYRIWLWSIGNPDLAVCTLNLLIPNQIQTLSPRERQFMELLGNGQATKEIATAMDVSVNTAHAHMRNIKTKLELSSTLEVLSFAARFFQQKPDEFAFPATMERPATLGQE